MRTCGSPWLQLSSIILPMHATITKHTHAVFIFRCAFRMLRIWYCDTQLASPQARLVNCDRIDEIMHWYVSSKATNHKFNFIAFEKFTDGTKRFHGLHNCINTKMGTMRALSVSWRVCLCRCLSSLSPRNVFATFLSSTLCFIYSLLSIGAQLARHTPNSCLHDQNISQCV